MNDYTRVSQVFDQLGELPTPEQRARLRVLAETEPELASEVEALFDHGADADRSGFLAAPLVGDHLQISPPRQPGLPHTTPTVDGYVVLDVLGSGSSGTVYRAQTDGPLDRHVALKVLHDDIPVAALARFEREQQMLAKLNHPGVAQVYDAGTTADRRPFVAVELIEGTSLTRYAAEHATNWHESVALVCGVCEAVQYIHSNGVLHRDLKPENILVAITDTGPQPKVIDFGSAANNNRDIAFATQHPRLIGTLAYMPPEQIEGKHAIDARSDVYAIGLILCEMLTGHHPFGARDLDLPRMIRAIEQSALPPLPKSLGIDRPELEAVLHKACAKDPSQRYPSPQHLADDLQRILHRRPIEARPPSLAFRTHALVSRRPASALVIMLALAAIAGLAVGLVRSAAHNADQSQRTRETMRLLVDDVLGELGELDGAQAVRARLADMLLERIEELDDPDEQAAVQRARIIDAIGDAAFVGGDYDRAVTIRETAQALAASLSADAPSDIDRFGFAITTTVKLGDAIATMQGKVSESPEALAIYEEAHELIKAKLVAFPDHPRLLDELSWSYERLMPFIVSDPKAAHDLALRRREVALRTTQVAPDRSISWFGLACADSALARTSHAIGESHTAVRHAEEAIARFEQLLLDEPNRFWFRSRYVIAHAALVQILFDLEDEGFHDAAVTAVRALHAFSESNPDVPLAQRMLTDRLGYMLDLLRKRGFDATADALHQTTANATDN